MTQFQDDTEIETLTLVRIPESGLFGMYPIGNCPIGLQEPMATIPTINEIYKLN